jgi:DNA mismatch repair ATPase MutS
MSGKSTLLRAIGVNAVLAQAGGPVCAEALTMPPLHLGTSFRVEDSLEAGVSFFMAELRRLKAIVDEAATCGVEKGWTYLFLLDEILQGTNVYERQIAVRHVLEYLMAQGAIGAISTHDLTLAETEGLAAAARAVHFTEDYRVDEAGPRMTFDYRLREGVAPTTNALKLLALVGLGSAEELSPGR